MTTNLNFFQLSFFAILAIAFAAPAPEPKAEPGAAILTPALTQVAYPQLGFAYPGTHIAYSAPLAYPGYSAYPAVPITYNKIYWTDQIGL